MIHTKTFLRVVPVIVFILVMSTIIGLSQTPSKSVKATGSSIHQLRIYEIFDGNKTAFHERFHDHAMRIMARYGFKIVATWEARHDNRTEFVYLLEWSDTETMKERWAAFMADQEWAEIKEVTAEAHGSLVGDIEERTLELTDYSPGKRLAN
ncbi:NIPSNAP family protein [Leptolyngbya sp. FACHB-671]|uniref:NIPSNAP family protein n=1 Tax=Leptolyngbya sp. FACHB-671 TaxID=2692812 RepID=UPI0018EF7D7D|nr:NIPSNAP family protein [Leptolyngbya sp. FACHB-671]